MAEHQLTSQECILQLDAWSVHRTTYKEWIAKKYPWIIVDFIPAGCTGLAQPCDVGIQRPLKLSIRRSQQQDILDEVKAKLGEDDDSTIILDKTIGTLRDRTVHWALQAYKEINKPEIVMKVS